MPHYQTLPGENFLQASQRRAKEKADKKAAAEAAMRSPAVMTIFKALNGMFVEMDAKVLEQSKEWATRRFNALKEWKKTEAGERKSFQSAWDYYDAAHRVAGGSTWYGIFTNGNLEMTLAFVAKNAKATAEARNAKIAKQLAKIGVKEINDTVTGTTADGFFGKFTVATDNGNKTITIKGIHAGGWNIQCWHVRTLVRVS